MKASVTCAVGSLLSLLTAVGIGAQERTPPAVQRDAGALALAQQAVTASGGAASLSALHRWKATGTIAYPSPSTQGAIAVTIMAAEKRRYREDVTLPAGSQSTVIADGTGVRKDVEGRKHSVSKRHSENQNAVLFPAHRLNEALADSSIAIVDRGVQTFDGRQLHEIGIYPGAARAARDIAANESDFFIDPASQQIVAFRELISQEFRYEANIPHEFLYSNFQSVNGIQAPFSVEERMMGRFVSTLTIQQVELNPEIADSEFTEQ